MKDMIEIKETQDKINSLLTEVYEAWDMLEDIYQLGEGAVDTDDFQAKLEYWLTRRQKEVKKYSIDD